MPLWAELVEATPVGEGLPLDPQARCPRTFRKPKTTAATRRKAFLIPEASQATVEA
ncbi:MAG: hypothetical protein ACPGSB_07680 [Opitutales bacterium]